MTSPSDLAATLQAVSEAEYVRFVADWLRRPDALEDEPKLTGTPSIDALVAAAATHVAFTRGDPIPAWTTEAARYAPTFWYPGPDALFPNALVHSPLSFFLHGVLVEADSLVSV